MNGNELIPHLRTSSTSRTACSPSASPNPTPHSAPSMPVLSLLPLPTDTLPSACSRPPVLTSTGDLDWVVHKSVGGLSDKKSKPQITVRQTDRHTREVLVRLARLHISFPYLFLNERERTNDRRTTDRRLSTDYRPTTDDRRLTHRRHAASRPEPTTSTRLPASSSAPTTSPSGASVEGSYSMSRPS